MWVEDKPYGQWEPFSKGLDAHWVLWTCFWAVTKTGLWDLVERQQARESIGLNFTSSILGHLSSCLWNKGFDYVSQMHTPWCLPWAGLWYSKIHFTEYDQWKCQSRQLQRQDTPKKGWKYWQIPWESTCQNSRKQRLLEIKWMLNQEKGNLKMVEKLCGIFNLPFSHLLPQFGSSLNKGSFLYGILVSSARD